MSFRRLLVTALGLLFSVPGSASAQPDAPPPAAEPVSPPPSAAPDVPPPPVAPVPTAPAAPLPPPAPVEDRGPRPSVEDRQARPEASGFRFGVLPSIGIGAAALTHPAGTPGVIAFTDVGVEALGEVIPWGGFLRGDLYSSGPDGLWWGFGFSAGVSKRLFGAPTELSLLARGGLAYDRWNTSPGCKVTWFVYIGCKNYAVPPPQSGVTSPTPLVTSYTANAIGLVGGLRLELPIRPAYVALDASLVPVVALDSPTPGAMFQFRLNLEFGFRDTRNMAASSGIGPQEEPGTRHHFN